MAAVDINIGAADEAGSFRCEKCDSVRNVFRGAPAAEGHLGTPSGLLLFKATAEIHLVVQLERVRKWALDAARANRVDQYPVLREFVRERLHKGVLSRVDHGRGDCVRLRHFSGLADDDDKAAAATMTHLLRNRPRQLPWANHLGLEVTQQAVA